MREIQSHKYDSEHNIENSTCFDRVNKQLLLHKKDLQKKRIPALWHRRDCPRQLLVCTSGLAADSRRTSREVDGVRRDEPSEVIRICPRAKFL